MKSKLLPLFSGVTISLAALAAIGCVSTTASVIDFNGIPDGTLVSAGNPYLGIVNLTATIKVNGAVGLNPFTQTYPGTIEGGVAALVPPIVTGGAFYFTDFTADFLKGVIDVSFDVAANRHGAYSYVAVDGQGNTITGGAPTGTGGLEPPVPHHIVVSLPSGYSIVKLDISDSDPNPEDAAMWINNLAFTVPPPFTLRLPIREWRFHVGQWPIPSLSLGFTTYTQAELLAILDTPTAGDASLVLARQLTAAILNIANGTDPEPISNAIDTANVLLAPGGTLPQEIKRSSAVGRAMVRLAAVLQRYNLDKRTPDRAP